MKKLLQAILAFILDLFVPVDNDDFQGNLVTIDGKTYSITTDAPAGARVVYSLYYDDSFNIIQWDESELAVFPLDEGFYVDVFATDASGNEIDVVPSVVEVKE